MQAQLCVGSHTPSGGSEWIGKAQGAPKPPQRSSPSSSEQHKSHLGAWVCGGHTPRGTPGTLFRSVTQG